MGIIDTDQQRQRLKRRKKGWKRLLDPRVFKTVLGAGLLIYRIARLMYEIFNRFSG